jgi:hypothetical protein
MRLSKAIGFGLMCIFFWRVCPEALSAEKLKIDVEKLATAINRAENSVKYPYGIKSINTHGDKDLARRICINTINHQLKNWKSAGSKGDFIEFLGRTYCPPAAHPLNKNWVRNVKHFYEARNGKDRK